MAGRKTGFLAVLVLMLAMCGGCTADEMGAVNWYDEMTQDNRKDQTDETPRNDINDQTDDGYGIDTGGPNWGNTERDSYGMKRDQEADEGNTLKEDIRNAWDNVKDDVKDMDKRNRGSKIK